MHKKPRLHVKSLADAMQQLRDALGIIDHQAAEVAKLTAIKEDEWAKRRAAETDAKAARAEHDDLKRRLFDSEVECSRLRGYMQRVAEDDAVADPLVEVEDQNGKRMVSKRHPTPRYDPPMYGGMADNGYDAYGNKREKPKHWVTY